MFWDLFTRWGTSDMDIMASKFNNNLSNKFIYRSRDPLAVAVDVLMALCDQFNLFFALPPLNLLPRLLCRIEMEGIPMILIA